MRPTTSQCIDACNMCISHLMDKANNEKNLLRASVSMTEVRKVQKQIYHGIGLKLSTDDFEPSIMFNVLQQCLRDMPDSLLIDIYDDIMKTDATVEAIQMKSILRSYLPKLPTSQFQLFRSVMMLLYKLTETGVGNDNNAQQISNTFSPYLCRPNATSFMSIRHVESLQKIKPVIQFIIEYQPDVFRDLKSTVVVRPRVVDVTPPVTHPILATSSSFPQHLPRIQVATGAITSPSLSISLPSDYSTGSNGSSIGSNTKKQSPISVNPIKFNDNSQNTGLTSLDSIETKLEDVELESLVERTVPVVHPLKFHAWEWKVLEDIVFDCSLSFLRRTSRDLDFDNGSNNNNIIAAAPDSLALTSTSFSSTDSNDNNNINNINNINHNEVERNINIANKPTITSTTASTTTTTAAASSMVSVHPLSGGLSVLSINANTNTLTSSINSISGFSVNDSLNLDDIMHSINSNTKASLRRSLSGGTNSGNNSPNSSKISRRRKMVMECKSMRNQISQYEEDCLKRLGKIPKASERTAVINKMYAAYRDKKKEIRDHAATDIQRTFRGMASRTRSGMALLPGGAALIQSRIRRHDMRQRDGHHRRIRPSSSPRSVPMDTDKTDKGGAGGGEHSQSKSRQDTLEGLLRGNDSRNQWGGKLVGSDASSVGDSTGSRMSGKAAAASDNPQSSELLAKYRALLMQKKDLKRRLKQFDEEFTERYGRGPKKTDKEVMRPMYQTYHEVKNNLEILRIRIEAMLGKGSLDQEDYDNETVVTKATTSSGQSSNTSGSTFTVDLSVNTSDSVTPRNPNYLDGSSGSMASGATTNSAGTSQETVSSAAAVDDRDEENDMMRENEIIEGDDFSSDSAGTNTSRLQALQQEKKTLHAYLKAYERDFNRVNGRQVTKPEDIVPVSAEYQRYKSGQLMKFT